MKSQDSALSPVCPRNTGSTAVTARRIKGMGEGKAFEGVSLGCPLARRGRNQTGLLLALAAARGGIFFPLAAGLRWPPVIAPGWLTCVYRVHLQATWGRAGGAEAPPRPIPRNRLKCHNRPLACRQPTFSRMEKPTGGVFRCARRLSPITGRARSNLHSPSESVRCDRPSANLEVS